MSTGIIVTNNKWSSTIATYFVVVRACMMLLCSATHRSILCSAFESPHQQRNLPVLSHPTPRGVSLLILSAQQVSQREAQKGIDKVVTTLRKDAKAIAELGKLEKVTIVLGYGCPSSGTLAVRFNAAFKKSGTGLSSVPLPFGLGQSNLKEGRGTMVGQVKASINVETGKVTSCAVFRDLGYGRSFDLKV